MTATTQEPSTTRIVAVARMHSVAWPLAIGAPAGILLVAFAIGWIIFFVLPNPNASTQFTGGTTSIFFFAIGFYIQAMTQTFPFALGLSVTRREFFTATALAGAVQAAVFGTVIYLLSLVETATSGWGVHMRMFGILDYLTTSPPTRVLTLVVLFFLVSSIGLLIGTIYLRWKLIGLMTLGAAAVIVIGGGIILILWQQWWFAVGDAIADTPRFVSLVVAPLIVALASLLGGWAVLRRTTP
ncbi:ABC transporter permease [Actinomycetes bacterium M1A6_2h]